MAKPLTHAQTKGQAVYAKVKKGKGTSLPPASQTVNLKKGSKLERAVAKLTGSNKAPAPKSKKRASKEEGEARMAAVAAAKAAGKAANVERTRSKKKTAVPKSKASQAGGYTPPPKLPPDQAARIRATSAMKKLPDPTKMKKGSVAQRAAVVKNQQANATLHSFAPWKL